MGSTTWSHVEENVGYQIFLNTMLTLQQINICLYNVNKNEVVEQITNENLQKNNLYLVILKCIYFTVHIVL